MTLSQSQTPTVQLLGMVHGAAVTQVLSVAAERDILGLLEDAPRTSADLAAASRTHEPSLRRLLQTMVGLGLVRRQSEGWGLTALGLAAAEIPPEPRWVSGALRELGRTIDTGTPAIELAFGCTLFDYLDAHPEEAVEFDRIMALVNAGEPQAVAEAYDFGGVERLVDVGGGNGTLLAAVLDRHPGLRGVLFDLPRTVEHPAPELAELSDRVQISGGDFFGAVPAGADAYVLSHVVHDWADAQAVAILGRVRAAIASGGRLLVVEMVMPTDDAPHPARMLDLTMLLLTAGGRERTEEEYAELLARAGFRLERVIPTASPVSVLEAVPV